MASKYSCGLVLAVGCWAFGLGGPSGSAVAPAPATEVADLRDQLENGLRARLPREFAFVGRVVDMVRRDQLPLDLVLAAFRWAQRKKPYPFPYFERALRRLAARRGIDI